MCHEDRHPREQPEDGDEVDEIKEDLTRFCVDVQVGEQAEDGAEAKSVDWHAALISAGKDARGFALSSQAIDGARGDV